MRDKLKSLQDLHLISLGDAAVVVRRQDGKVKVMGLRNIELTAPYGHNGFFPTLYSIVHFYIARIVKQMFPNTGSLN